MVYFLIIADSIISHELFVRAQMKINDARNNFYPIHYQIVDLHQLRL